MRAGVGLGTAVTSTPVPTATWGTTSASTKTLALTSAPASTPTATNALADSRALRTHLWSETPGVWTRAPIWLRLVSTIVAILLPLADLFESLALVAF